MNIFVKADLGAAAIEIPITDNNTYTRCVNCGAPIQLSLDRVAELYSDAPAEYKSLTDYFNHGFICESCADEDDRED